MNSLLTPEAKPPPASAMDADPELIERAKLCSEALTEIYHIYQPRISAYVLRRISCRHEAEDIVSDVFTNMVKGIRRYRVGEAPFITWLYRIATNEIARHARKKRVREFFAFAPPALVEESLSAGDCQPIRVAIEKLPKKYQDVIVLHYLEQLSIEDVAVTLKCAPGTVKSRLSRGRDRLRRFLEPLADDHDSLS